MLTIAIQKSGRLNENSLELLNECGIKFKHSRNSLKQTAKNFPLELLNLRNSDIPFYVSNGVADIGIIGENSLLEHNHPLTTIKKLGFGKCKLSLAVPKEVDYNSIKFFDGKKIATSYPNSLNKFLIENNIVAKIHEISGSVEIAPSIGLADGVCDLVESGSTLFMNGLKEVEVLFNSQAVLIANNNLTSEKQGILNKLLFRIEATLNAKNNKYVVLNLPNENLEKISKLLPGINSPTIIPLKKIGWSALHSVISEIDFWNSIEQLKALGAEGILVMPIEKMIS
ncbi:MAG: ATP phosphoribosyltransferase [Solirubrobacteraceae bacterium]